MNSTWAVWRVAVATLILAVIAHRAVAQPPDILRDYRFIPADTVVHVSGGLPGYDMDLTIAGKFGLITGYQVTPTAPVPSLVPFADFVDVHGILYNPLSMAPLPVPGWDLDKTLNLSGLHGTFSPSDPNRLFFLGADGQGVAIRLQAVIDGRLLHLTGGSSDPPSSNSVLYQVNALAHLVPFPDFNFDGAITVADVPAMLDVLAGPQASMAAHSLSADDLVSMGDLDGDGKVTNADIQGLINLLANGGGSAGGSLAAVPEPGSLVLLALGGVIALCRRQRIGVRNSHS